LLNRNKTATPNPKHDQCSVSMATMSHVTAQNAQCRLTKVKP
jgi:hypothetical protein